MHTRPLFANPVTYHDHTYRSGVIRIAHMYNDQKNREDNDKEYT